ncbi:MAG TPA: ATP-binding protein [Bryobacteraceae bacterium]
MNSLERSNRDLEQFAFVASHDLQEPLRIISIYSDLLLRKTNTASPDELRQYREFIQEGVKRMSSLIRDVLQYSRVIHGELQISPVDANIAVAEALKALRTSVEEADAEIAIEPLPTVQAALYPLIQVFQNLLSNAIRYRRSNVPPIIRIAARINEDVAIFEVSDNGAGFDQQYATKVFDLFTRLDNKRDGGTGLGLAFCKRVIERYGGRIWAESAAGVGTKLFFQLPLETQ